RGPGAPPGGLLARHRAGGPYQTQGTTMNDTLRRRLLLASAALPAACAVPAIRPGTPLPAGATPARLPRPGERWRYASRNGYNTVGQGELLVEMREETGRQVHEWRT